MSKGLVGCGSGAHGGMFWLGPLGGHSKDKVELAEDWLSRGGVGKTLQREQVCVLGLLRW